MCSSSGAYPDRNAQAPKITEVAGNMSVWLAGFVSLTFKWSPWGPNGEAFRGTTFAAWLSSMCLSSLCNVSLHGGIHVHRSLIIEHDEENSNKNWVCAGSRKAPALTGRCIRQRR